jgi:hypothetical protein
MVPPRAAPTSGRAHLHMQVGPFRLFYRLTLVVSSGKTFDLPPRSEPLSRSENAEQRHHRIEHCISGPTPGIAAPPPAHVGPDAAAESFDPATSYLRDLAGDGSACSGDGTRPPARSQADPHRDLGQDPEQEMQRRTGLFLLNDLPWKLSDWFSDECVLGRGQRPTPYSSC